MYGFKSLEEVLEEIGAPQLTDGKLRPTTCIHLHKIIYDPKKQKRDHQELFDKMDGGVINLNQTLSDRVLNPFMEGLGKVSKYVREKSYGIEENLEHAKKVFGRGMFDRLGPELKDPKMVSSGDVRLAAFYRNLGLNVGIDYCGNKLSKMQHELDSSLQPFVFQIPGSKTQERTNSPYVEALSQAEAKYSEEDIAFCNALADMLPRTQDSWLSFAAGFKGERGIAVSIYSKTLKIPHSVNVQHSDSLHLVSHLNSSSRVLYRLNE
ncbi:hypothetical protein HOD05_02735 [Candidatus Woesearchaeota archaeon]|jgi:hypothetical protein|nr:hypothetical protein [Candidatus Woesearchaeota archaeon]MBT4151288.1 hypothetical protein [Candidatus Woesearchaeota archaeon]MBT4247475.1 hypothetical protein [Candidatus Woesearchaeota archaeon]MBT4434110.1 hypothetical protein [Candidatus Woesearchaeota archaeon]MBT7332233.1 hypothetical protein [Candidatus Woesearchaeota archaeon]